MQGVPVESVDLDRVVGCNVEHPVLPEHTVVSRVITWSERPGWRVLVLSLPGAAIVVEADRPTVLFRLYEECSVERELSPKSTILLTFKSVNEDGETPIPAELLMAREGNDEILVITSVVPGVIRRQRWTRGDELYNAKVVM